ncbi:Auxin response factor [Quillaja saponaria]|uniref:Auxin response factor n=1 Tax=Quillaja saponaria TaxID=32244 RepID=A0AAD7LWU2_QUISA|nr:Auxin response factor [Quillaja saponaria]
MPPAPQPQPQTATQLRRLDPKIWRACAGTSVQIPIVNSRVYYFPQGHLEQTSSPPQFLSPHLLSKPVIPCRISVVSFLADPVTDEVFAKLLLHPDNGFSNTHHYNHFDSSVKASDDDRFRGSVLTPVFPPLNYQADPPVQTLSVTDVHGVVWEFRHIYRGTPRRHLLTTGWSKFVNNKKLVAGDSVVFMKNWRGEMFIGIGGMRRMVEEEQQEEGCKGFGGREGFSRNGSGKSSAKAVAEAAESAAQDMPFEVVYYPRAGWSDFVVKAEVVEEALKVFLTPGMRVKMAMETEDSSRMTWFQGTISSASVPDNVPWQDSPWRMLQVTWDEPEVLQNAKRVSPWQVEYVSPTPQLHTACPPAKRFRAPHSSGPLSDGEGDSLFAMTGFTNSSMGNMKQPLLNCETFPAGMQGARHDLFSVSNFSNFVSEKTANACTDNSFGNITVPKLKRVSTELNIGSSLSDNLSPDSQSSVHSFGTEFVGSQCCNSTKLAAGSFQLFGKIIHMNQPVESGFHGSGCTGDDGSKGYNETEGIDNPPNLSLTCSKLLDRLDVQYQRASAIEACYL